MYKLAYFFFFTYLLCFAKHNRYCHQLQIITRTGSAHRLLGLFLDLVQ